MLLYSTGIDPAPDCLHIAVAKWADGALVSVDARTSHHATNIPTGPVAIEDPSGVLFGKTSTLLWSKTCQMSGQARAETAGVYVKAGDARALLGRMAGTKTPSNDREVREVLQLLYGDNAIDKGLKCRKLNNKSHDGHCDICGGSGLSRDPGLLVALNSSHYRDAFLCALWAHHKLRF